MNFGSVVILLVILGIVVLIIRSMVSDRKKGKSLQCGGDCRHCGRHCGHGY